MQIDLIMVGKRMPDWIDSAVNEYVKRLPKHISIDLIEVAPANRQRKDNVDNYKRQEQENILAAIKPDSLLIALDEHGKTQSTASLASILQNWIDNQLHIAMIIGGADGLNSALLKQANQC